MTWVTQQQRISIRRPLISCLNHQLSPWLSNQTTNCSKSGRAALRWQLIDPSAMLISAVIWQGACPFCSPTAGGSLSLLCAWNWRGRLLLGQVLHTQSGYVLMHTLFRWLFFNGTETRREGRQTSMPACLHYGWSRCLELWGEIRCPIKTRLSLVLVCSDSNIDGTRARTIGRWKQDVSVRMSISNLLGNSNGTGSKFSFDHSLRLQVKGEIQIQTFSSFSLGGFWSRYWQWLSPA